MASSEFQFCGNTQGFRGAQIRALDLANKLRDTDEASDKYMDLIESTSFEEGELRLVHGALQGFHYEASEACLFCDAAMLSSLSRWFFELKVPFFVEPM